MGERRHWRWVLINSVLNRLSQKLKLLSGNIKLVLYDISGNIKLVLYAQVHLPCHENQHFFRKMGGGQDQTLDHQIKEATILRHEQTILKV